LAALSATTGETDSAVSAIERIAVMLRARRWETMFIVPVLR